MVRQGSRKEVKPASVTSSLLIYSKYLCQMKVYEGKEEMDLARQATLPLDYTELGNLLGAQPTYFKY